MGEKTLTGTLEMIDSLELLILLVRPEQEHSFKKFLMLRNNHFFTVVSIVLVCSVGLVDAGPGRELRRGNICNGNDGDGVRYKCLTDSKYAICSGETYLGKGKCHRHTECQCNPNSFNRNSPCGSDSSLALCLNDDTDALCKDNGDDQITYACEDDDIFVTCDGDESVNRGLVPPGTECQCSELTCSPPWGTDDSQSKCKEWKSGKCRHK
jgi:hypothetical protein